MNFGKRENRLIYALDIANIIISVILVALTVFLLVDISGHENLFTIIFLLGMILNVTMTVKYYKRSDVPRVIALIVFALILLALSVISFVSIWL